MYCTSGLYAELMKVIAASGRLRSMADVIMPFSFFASPCFPMVVFLGISSSAYIYSIYNYGFHVAFSCENCAEREEQNAEKKSRRVTGGRKVIQIGTLKKKELRGEKTSRKDVKEERALDGWIPPLVDVNFMNVWFVVFVSAFSLYVPCL